MNWKQLLCSHDWVPFRGRLMLRFRDTIAKEAKDKKAAFVPHSEYQIDDDHETIYRILQKEHMFPGSDDMCSKCDKFNFKLTRWMIKKDAEYHSSRGKILARQEFEAATAKRAMAIIKGLQRI